MPFRSIRVFALTIILALTAYVAHAEPRKPTPAEIQELNAASSDSTRAPEAVAKLRALLATELDGSYVSMARQMLLRALVLSRAPGKEIANAADSAAAVFSADAASKTFFYAQVAQVLIDRGEELGRAGEFAKKAVETCPDDAQATPLRGLCWSILGQTQLLRGEADAAIATFTKTLSISADSGSVLYSLGKAYDKKGKTDLAINAYVRSLGAFPAHDTAAAAPLRAAYKKRFGSLKGLDEKIAASHEASVRLVALDARRHEQPAPGWELPDLTGKTIQLADYQGKIVVIDFWGSWCGPCRAELPYFQAMYEKYKDQGVEFVGINWERAPTTEERYQAAKNFIESNSYTFPVVLDHNRQAVTSYSVDSFPSVFLVDRTGQIRYLNKGFSDTIDDILIAQIESLMK